MLERLFMWVLNFFDTETWTEYFIKLAALIAVMAVVVKVCYLVR